MSPQVFVSCSKNNPVESRNVAAPSGSINPCNKTQSLSNSGNGIVIFGPKIYCRTTGAPNVFTDSIFSYNKPKILLIVENGDGAGNNRVSSASIRLNGLEIIRENEVNQNIGKIEKTFQLPSDNSQIEVLLRGAPGGRMTITASLIIEKYFPIEWQTYLNDIRTVARGIARLLPHHSISPAQTIRELMARAPSSWCTSR